MSLLLQHIMKHIELSEAEQKTVLNAFIPRKLRKRQYFLQEGDISRFEAFILRGCVRTYEINSAGSEHVLQFGVEEWWVGDLYSFLSGNPSKLNIDCLEDCELLVITREELETLYIKVPKLERFFRILIQNAYIAASQRILDNMAKPAVERYSDFIRKYPDIEQRVSNHQIASYLGITPESLSRLRNKLYLNKE